MQIREWFRPPRHVLAIFLAVSLVCGATLGALAWLLVRQDRALEFQRRQERIEQAADRSVAVMQRSLAVLESQLAAQPGRNSKLPPDVVILSAGPTGIAVRPDGGLLYYPAALDRRDESQQAFEAGEQLEFAKQDPQGAIQVYTRLALSDQAAVRAGALNRLARLHRKLQAPEAALTDYDRLAQMHVSVEGIPAGLLARVGRASLFEDAHRTAELRREAAALDSDLHSGRWRLLQHEYAFHSGLARQWLGKANPRTTPEPLLGPRRRSGSGRTAARRAACRGACSRRRASRYCCSGILRETACRR